MSLLQGTCYEEAWNKHLQIAAISFAVFVCPSVHMEQLNKLMGSLSSNLILWSLISSDHDFHFEFKSDKK